MDSIKQNLSKVAGKVHLPQNPPRYTKNHSEVRIFLFDDG